uniref:Gag/pol polyprotein n=1 Tax=Solanum tuberosum TaxID=4113 RepID=M1DVI2_SOLTU
MSSISYEGKKTPRKSSSYQVGPKPINIGSKFYRPDQRCTYHSNGVGLDTKDCINLKHNIQDLIDQKVVSLRTVAPNVNNNPLPNHGYVTINMIETDDDWCVTKAIAPIAPDELERAVASLSIREKKKFVILTPEKVFGLGKHFQGIVGPIQIPAKGAKFGLGYVPTDDKAETKNKSVDQVLTRPIPHLYQSFSVREYVNNSGLGEESGGLFEEIDAVIEEEAGTSGIRDAKPEEQLQNWTSTPLLISRSSR